MKISVVIASYNGEKYIKEQLDSILNQTIKPDEVIISDDRSLDNTVNIVKKYIQKYNLFDKWKLIINKKNKGYAKNFLDASMLASGDIIFFCDQDDIWVLDRIKRMKIIMEKNININLLCTNLLPFYYEENTRKWNKKVLSSMTNDESLEVYPLTAKNFHLKRSGCTMCVRKCFLNNIYPYWTNGWAHDDFVWKMAVASNSCYIYQYTSIKRRMHNNNATVIRTRTRNWRKKQIDEFEKQFDSYKLYCTKLKLSKNKMNILKKNIKCIKLRKSVLYYHNVFSFFRLILNYRDCYPRIKGLFLDGYFIFFNKYEGV